MGKSLVHRLGILLGCGILSFWAGVIAFGYPGVFTAYWQDRYHVGNGETGLVVTFMLLALAIAMFVSGRVQLKYGMKCCVFIGTFVDIIAFVFITVGRNIYWIYAWGFIVNLGCSFLYGPSLTTAQMAFPDNRGLVSGVINFIFGVSAAILSPILNSLLEKSGYVFTNILVIILIVICNIISFFLFQWAEHSTTTSSSKSSSSSIPNSNQTTSSPTNNKREMEMETETETETETKIEIEEKKTSLDNIEKDKSVKEALKTREFWTIWLIWAFMGAAGISMVSLSKTYSIAIEETGVFLLTIFNLANGIFRIFVGWISDYIGSSLTGAIAFFLAALGYGILTFVKNLTVISIAVVGVGIGFGTLFTVSGPLASIIFGLKNFGMIYGLIFTGYGIVGGIVGPAVSGMILEKTNDNYTVVFIYLGVMALIGTLLMISIKEKGDSKNSRDKENSKNSNKSLVGQAIEMKTTNVNIEIEEGK